MILTVEEAAVLLGVDPHTVTLWERRFGCPSRVQLSHDQWGYAQEELIALRVELDATFSISAAVARVHASSRNPQVPRHAARAQGG